MITLAVDPSLTKPGAALFDGQVLLRAARVRIPALKEVLDPGDRAAWVAQLITSWVGVLNRPAIVVYERPQIYRSARSKGDPNDLIGLAEVGAGIVGYYRGIAMLDRDYSPPQVRAPTPAQWIGQLPKSEKGDPWDSPRGARIKSRLSPEELLLVESKHDAVDACGIGLWSLGRLERIRVFPGATSASGGGDPAAR